MTSCGSWSSGESGKTSEVTCLFASVNGISLNASLPHVVEITGRISAEDAFRVLSHRPHCVFLDSARNDSTLGRYSFLAVDPFELIVADDRDGLRRIKQALATYSQPALDGLPPLQGGAIGCLSYDLGQSLEALPRHRFDEFQIPRLCMGLYDTVLAFDHVQSQAWLVSQGFPELDPAKRSSHAKRRADELLGWLEAAPSDSVPEQERPLSMSELAPQYETSFPGVFSNFTSEQYVQTVARGIEYIFAGDVFQVNLAQRLLSRAGCDSPSLYSKLRSCNPAPFAGYFDGGSFQIVSASPERFLQVDDGLVETRPIKGTRRRLSQPEADLFSGAELTASGKDLAENVMIVDLMRNDLSRVCEDASVRVTQLCGLETFEHVQHLVSVVEGRLRDGVTNVDLIECAFPGGSITGAPKIRAMEIIAELEPTSRGAYCGSMGYLGFSGAMDLNILIRTITSSRGWWQFPVGGGVVAQSNPEAELSETWAKAEGILQAVSGWPESVK